MGFRVSPGVNVSEIDLTTSVPAVSTTEGAVVGPFRWGPIEQRVLVDSEETLVATFQSPTNDNADTFFTAANFLSYGNKLYVQRVASGALNGVGYADSGANTGTLLIKNQDEFEAGVTTDTNWKTASKYAGAIGNSIRVEICDSSAAYSSTLDISGAANTSVVNASASAFDVTVGSNVAVLSVTGVDNVPTAGDLTDELDTVVAGLQVGDVVKVGNSSIGTQYLEVTAIAANTADTSEDTGGGILKVSRNVSLGGRYTLAADISANTISREWKYAKNFDAAPGTSEYAAARGGVGDELHVVVVDENGDISGVRETVLEIHAAVSRATDARNDTGERIAYATYINNRSQFAYILNDPAGAYTGTSSTITALSTALPYRFSHSNGADGSAESALSLADFAKGYDLLADAADVDVSLIMVGHAIGGTHGEGALNYVIDNVCETRKDCIVFGGPAAADTVNIASQSDATDNVVEFRNACRASSYGVLASGHKYQYDKYNDEYRWVPLAGDIAGLCARTDDVRDPWYSPGGFNRGQIKNVVKLSFNPRESYRDILYSNGINPVVAFPGEGTILYGDKTLLAKPSAFSRINVRRLFIVLEKAIATSAKYSLFEFNNEFTRAQFVNQVEPFLRDIQGRNGIIDFEVVCDTSNNTGEVIDRNEFIGDIFIKPARSINYIQLNFVAVKTSVEFAEVVGRF